MISGICHRRRTGQSLVEFAVVALVLYMLLAAILTFGHALYVAQGLQTAADLAAREISRTPLSVAVESLDRDDGTVEYALSDEDVRARIFDDAYLVIDLDAFYEQNPGSNIFTDIVPELPLLNQQLVTMMIVDRPVIDGQQRQLLRYPGAILNRSTPLEKANYAEWVVTDLTVAVPLINADDSIRWVSVVEEVESGDENPFDVSTNGVVAIRLNYPFQSASMSSFEQDESDSDFPSAPTIGNPIGATNSFTPPESPDGSAIDQPLVRSGPSPTYTGTYGGKLGLGAQGAFGQTVRPYRRVISAQAIYRREVFAGNEATPGP